MIPDKIEAYWSHKFVELLTLAYSQKNKNKTFKYLRGGGVSCKYTNVSSHDQQNMENWCFMGLRLLWEQCLGTVHKHLLGDLMQKGGNLKVLTLPRRALKKWPQIILGNSLYDFLWGWPIIFMSKRTALKFFRSEMGTPKNFRIDFFFSSAPQQVFVNGPLGGQNQPFSRKGVPFSEFYQIFC